MADWYGGIAQSTASSNELEDVLKNLSPEKAEQIRSAMGAPVPAARPPLRASRILEAAMAGNYEPWASALLSGALSIDFKDADGLTLMHRAVLTRDNALVGKLLDAAGCPVDIRTKDLQTPLMVAAARGNLSVIKTMLDRGADIEAEREDKMTAILVAAQSRELNAILVLRGRGANTHHTDSSGNGLTHLAAMQNDVQTLRALKAMGMSLTEKDNQGMTPLHKAAIANAYQAILFLLKTGCDATAMDIDKMTPLNVAKKYQCEAALHALSIRHEESLFLGLFSLWFAAYIALIAFTYVTYIAESAAEYLLCSLTLSVFLCQTPVLYLLVRCSDPGVVVRQGDSLESSAVRIVEEKFEEGKFDEIPRSDRFCLTCHLIRPLRSKHCIVCDKCVPKQDLHCSVLGRCVGAGNRRRFVGWIASVFVLASLHLYLEWAALNADIADSSLTGYCSLLVLQFISQPPANMLAILLDAAVLWYCGCHLFLMLYSITYAQTANEVLNRHRYRYLFGLFIGKDGSKKMRFLNPFYKSAARSWLDFLINEK